MDLRDLITEEEYQALNDYRNDYAFQGYKHNENMNPIKDILTYWNDNKQDLYHLLGDNLIISKQLNYIRAEDEIAGAIADMFRRPSSEHNPIIFKDAYIEWVEQYCESELSDEIYCYLHSLICSYELAKNAYRGADFSIDLPNGKQYKIQYGTKVIKILGKIASAFNLPGFEDFRICHSLYLNDKKMTGELCLSIHPLDYWTMSDNNYDWTSCMSWEDVGCYRQGTVEMMNSPMVIVAYLNGKEPYYPTYNFRWSNKKWRQLFIVNQDIIMGIKGYSYQNDDLTKQIINWIAELAEKNLGWKFRDYMCEYSHNEITYQGDQMVSTISFHTHYMYNDIDCLPHHYCRLGNEIKQMYNYSGETQCVCCGAVTSVDSESCLCCPECDEVRYCDYCDSPINDCDEYYTIGNNIVCENCHAEHTTYCPGCEEDVWTENTYSIQLVDYDTQINKNIILTSDIFLCSDCYRTLYREIPIYESKDGMICMYINDVRNSFLSTIIPWTLENADRIQEKKTQIKNSSYGHYNMIDVDSLTLLNAERFPEELNEKE